MVPTPLPHEIDLRKASRARLARVAYGLNAATFLIAAWDGVDTRAAVWSVATNAALGLVQLAALTQSRGGTLPERLPYGLAAAGMLTSVLTTLHHRTGLPYAYGLAMVVNLALATAGPERVRRLVRRSRGATSA